MSESLEEKYALVRDMLQRMAERVSALELAANSADRSLVEALRRDRWHATRDAVLGGVSLREYGIDKALHWATEAADRAHGPLVRPLVAPDAPDSANHRSLVVVCKALVRNWRDMAASVNQADSPSIFVACAEDLEAALDGD